MAGCFGNNPEDRARQRELNNYLDAADRPDNNERIKELARDKFNSLPSFYSPKGEKYRYTFMDDAMDSLKQEELIAIARLLRDGEHLQAGKLLEASLMRVLVAEAEEEIEDEENDPISAASPAL